MQLEGDASQGQREGRENLFARKSVQLAHTVCLAVTAAAVSVPAGA